ncbi:hypothetical protein [Dietzia massiliensis]|uniref:hypothetical protein n=1 Tax=Dietzia massiliensis TaxID=2697499 RepID=UPI001F1DFCB1|nr:hypothetical protein [Dietzia massiliensis]
MAADARRSRVRALTVVSGGSLALVLGACGAMGPAGSDVVVVTSVTTITPGSPSQGGVGEDPPEPVGSPTEATPRSDPMPPTAGGLDDLVSAAAGFTGIAVTPVGGGAPVDAAGAWTTGVAWSTIKVPLAVAAARSSPQALEASASAITSSDNAAAQALWDGLGGGGTSAAAVGAVLAEGGDPTSQVPSQTTRPGYTTFGQTHWALTDQARFGSRLPCLGGAGRVVGLMGQIAPDQRWGLGRIPGARFKGGWGPGETGGYLVRQFGIVPAAGGDVAVAIATDAPSFEAGVATLSGVADALAPRLAAMPGGFC